MNAATSRIIERALSRLTGVKSFIDVRSIEDLQSASIAHDLQLPDGRTLMLSDSGLKELEALVSILHEADSLDGLVDYSDLWTASKRTYAELLTAGLQPAPCNQHQGVKDQKVAHTVDPQK